MSSSTALELYYAAASGRHRRVTTEVKQRPTTSPSRLPLQMLCFAGNWSESIASSR